MMHMVVSAPAPAPEAPQFPSANRADTDNGSKGVDVELGSPTPAFDTFFPDAKTKGSKEVDEEEDQVVTAAEEEQKRKSQEHEATRKVQAMVRGRSAREAVTQKKKAKEEQEASELWARRVAKEEAARKRWDLANRRAAYELALADVRAHSGSEVIKREHV